MYLIIAIIVFLLLTIITGGNPKCREFTRQETENLIAKNGFDGAIKIISDNFIKPIPKNFITEDMIIRMFKKFQETGKGSDILVDYWYPTKAAEKDVVKKIVERFGKYSPELVYKFSGKDPTKHFNFFKKYKFANIPPKPEMIVAALAAGCDVSVKNEMVDFYRKFFKKNKSELIFTNN